MFTAHNIELPDGTQTKPGWPLTADNVVCRAALRCLGRYFAENEVAETSLLDLGCLEGGYAVAFARAGFRVTAIEAREINMEKCRYVEKQLCLDNLRFMQTDARNLAEIGTFDAVFCCGLLYHLDHPSAFLDTLGTCTRRVLILDTHVASDYLPTVHAAQLSEMTTHEGNLGRWYREYPDSATSQQIAGAVWASWGNSQSFWIEKMSLVSNLVQVGFSSVCEQFAYLTDPVAADYYKTDGRSMFIAAKD